MGGGCPFVLEGSAFEGRACRREERRGRGFASAPSQLVRGRVVVDTVGLLRGVRREGREGRGGGRGEGGVGGEMKVVREIRVCSGRLPSFVRAGGDTGAEQATSRRARRQGPSQGGRQASSSGGAETDNESREALRPQQRRSTPASRTHAPIMRRRRCITTAYSLVIHRLE